MLNKAAAEGAMPDIVTARALGDVPRERKCLRCDALFRSEGFGERVCGHCKGRNAWRNAVSFSSGTSRRR